ncbi:MAG: biotin--[acetyl-CoA-carboxylase] ligase [Nitrospirota bacterium]
MHVPDILLSNEIESALKSELIGKYVFLFDEVDSTNTKARELAEKGYDEGTVIMAENQSKGRGRLGRVWVSPPGVNFYISIILKPELVPAKATRITMLVAVAVASVLRKTLSLPVTIRWPNDILVRDRKLGGILIEMDSEMDRVNYVVIGIGINVNMDISILPDGLQKTATSIKRELGHEVKRIDILIPLLKGIGYWYRVYKKDGIHPVLNEWINLSSILGKRIRLSTPKKVIEGKAEGIDEDGRLIIGFPDGSFELASSGDVTVIK